jgi:ATP-binding cassette subfamily B protein
MFYVQCQNRPISPLFKIQKACYRMGMKHFHFYRQPDSMDCGPTCLRMVAKYYKKEISLQYLRDKAGLGKAGVDLLGLSEAAEALGFRSITVKLEFSVLIRDALLPAVLHWKQNHFVVLYKKTKKKLWIADPALGLIAYSIDEFKSFWLSDKTGNREEGIGLLLEPSPAFYTEDSGDKDAKPQQFKNIFHYIIPYKKLIVQLFIGLGLASLLQLFLPFLTQSIVDTGIRTGNLHFIYLILLAQLALFAGRMVIEFVRSWILLHISTRINIAILTDFLIKLMKLPLGFFDSKHTGDILQRMNDHSRIEAFLTGASLNTLFSLINLGVFSIVLVVFNVYIFSVFLIAGILYGGWVLLFLRKKRQLDHKRFDIASKEQGISIQLIQGMQDIRLNGIEKPMRWTWERLQVKLFRLGMKGLSLSQWQQSGAFFINEGKNILISFLAARSVIEGQMTLGSMLAVQYIIGQLNSPMEQMIGFLQSWQNAKISMGRLNEIHSLRDEEPGDRIFQYHLPPGFSRKLTGGRSDPENAVPSFPIFSRKANTISSFIHETSFAGESIHMKNLSFTYPGAGNEPVLKDISLSLPVGRTTAIVGVSGSGKTTLLKILLKFYEPQKGTVTLGDTALAHISHKTWRSHCGVVMQESFIYSDTLAGNIAPGVETVDMERLYQAVEVANIREFIESLPLGFNTRIGADGTGLSMGQKQRILIARAVYRDPEFIFFDEATNSLDANNEQAIIENLSSFCKGRTVIVVAHRLSTVKNASQIVVLNRGVITERGTHQELVHLKGDYYTLVRNQLELGL